MFPFTEHWLNFEGIDSKALHTANIVQTVCSACTSESFFVPFKHCRSALVFVFKNTDEPVVLSSKTTVF
jgi:hypothetical protein